LEEPAAADHYPHSIGQTANRLELSISQADTRQETSHEEDFLAVALVVTFAATAAAPAMAEQFVNPFSQR
jgi:hypothetical protein